jgi:hypothetical protein
MGKRHPNHRLVKIHRSYTVEEIARLFGHHKNSVRTWIKRGLPTIDKQRPMLILGSELVAYLKVRRAKNKCTCHPDEIYCVRCRAAKKPANGLVEYNPVTETTGNLIAICPTCESIMNRRTSLAKSAEFLRRMDNTLPQAQRHISERDESSVNSDLQKEH